MEGENHNYWPGFVDALSNMVMAMIFVVLTFVVVLFGVMQNNIRAVATRMNEMRAVSAGYQTTLSALRQENAALEVQLARMQAGSPGQKRTSSLLESAVTVVGGKGGDSPAAATGGRLPPLVTGEGNVITVLYPSSQATLDAAARAALDQLAVSRLANPAALHAEIVSDMAGAAAATDSQRLAYFRALEARNYLLSHGLASANITVRLVPGPRGEARGRVVIRIFAP